MTSLTDRAPEYPGPRITADVRQGIRAFRQLAEAEYVAWRARCCAGAVIISQAKVKPSDQAQLHTLLEEACRAGIRQWLAECEQLAVYAELSPRAVLTLEDLREWCELQYRMIELYPRSVARYVVTDWWGFRLGRASLIHVASPLLYDRSLSSEKEEDWLAYQVRDLEWVPADAGPDPGAYYSEIVRRTWALMRRLGTGWPPRPLNVQRPDEAEQAIDLVMNWLDQIHRPEETRQSASPVSVLPPLTKVELSILQELDGCPTLLTQTDIEARIPFSRRTIGPALQNLRAHGLVNRPYGPKRGEAITPEGRAALKASDANCAN